MSLRLGDTAPNFEQQSSEGEINFYEFLGDDWAILFSHPADYTPVCTTELGYTAKLKDEFEKRGVKTPQSTSRSSPIKIVRFQSCMDLFILMPVKPPLYARL